MRYFMELKYDGSQHCGWQRQPNATTIQGDIENALSLLLRKPIEVVGAGRTDTGVNAAYYTAHFDTEQEIDCQHIAYKLNAILPHTISIDSIALVSDSLHARFDAQEREYTYIITTQKNPFLRGSAWFYNGTLDTAKMSEALHCLLRYEDFTSFAKLNSNNTTNICHIMAAECDAEPERGIIRIRLRANRFLRNMVRAIVGTVVDVGRGRYTVDEFCQIIEARDLSLSSGGAPAQGLYLTDVKYDPSMFTRKQTLTNTNFFNF